MFTCQSLISKKKYQRELNELINQKSLKQRKIFDKVSYLNSLIFPDIIGITFQYFLRKLDYWCQFLFHFFQLG